MDKILARLALVMEARRSHIFDLMMKVFDEIKVAVIEKDLAKLKRLGEQLDELNNQRSKLETEKYCPMCYELLKVHTTDWFEGRHKECMNGR